MGAFHPSVTPAIDMPLSAGLNLTKKPQTKQTEEDEAGTLPPD
jgi:hypothetical protein